MGISRVEGGPNAFSVTWGRALQLGMIITSLPAINAIPAVCQAAPGIRTYADIPLVTGAGFLK